MVLVGDLGELLEADAVILVGVRHTSLGEHTRHGCSAENAVYRGDRPEPARRLVDIGLDLGATGEQAHLSHLLDTDSEAH